MNEILVKLEDRGLLRREVDPDHARILRAALTPEGLELLAAAELAVKAIQDELFGDLSEPQREVMIAGLRSAMEKLRSGRRGDVSRSAAAGSGERRVLAAMNRRILDNLGRPWRPRVLSRRSCPSHWRA